MTQNMVNVNTNIPTTMESMFEAFPDDIKEMVYVKIMYPQPRALQKEIRTRGIIYKFSCMMPERKLNPTDIAIAMSDMSKKERKRVFDVFIEYIENKLY